jgi:hypothetical protein
LLSGITFSCSCRRAGKRSVCHCAEVRTSSNRKRLGCRLLTRQGPYTPTFTGRKVKVTSLHCLAAWNLLKFRKTCIQFIYSYLSTKNELDPVH